MNKQTPDDLLRYAAAQQSQKILNKWDETFDQFEKAILELKAICDRFPDSKSTVNVTHNV